MACQSIALAEKEDIDPVEWRFVAAASTRRQADFANGRACAHAAIQILGATDAPIGIGTRGMPLWPKGVVGSIAHCDGFCGAVVMRAQPRQSLGFDIELRAGLKETFVDAILTNTERKELATVDPDGHMDRLAVVFSAKEAFYKAQFPVTGLFLDFKDVSVTPAAGKFGVRLEKPVAGLGEAGDCFVGRYLVKGRHVLTGLALSGAMLIPETEL